MATFNIVAGTRLQLRVYCTFRGQLAINTLYYVVTAAPVNPNVDFAQTLPNVSTNLAAVYKPWLTTAATYYGIGLKVLLSPAGGGMPESWSPPQFDGTLRGVGSGGADPAPTQCAGLLSWSTAQPGKPGKGRTYLPFFDQTSTDLTTGLINAAGQVKMINLLQAFLPPGTTFPFQNTLGAESFGGSLNIHKYGGNNYYAVTTGINKLGVATQRRRGTTFGRLNQPPF